MQCAEKKKDDKADLEKGQVGVLVSLQMEWRCTHYKEHIIMGTTEKNRSLYAEEKCNGGILYY